MTAGEVVEGINGYLQSDGKADYITLIEGLGLIGDIASVLIGFIVVVIITGLPLIVAIETLYINIPIIQGKAKDIYEKLGGHKNKVVGLVLKDGVRAVELAHTSEYGSSANLIYLKLKTKAIFMYVFIVAMVLGPGQFLIMQAWKLVEGLVNSIV